MIYVTFPLEVPIAHLLNVILLLLLLVVLLLVVLLY